MAQQAVDWQGVLAQQSQRDQAQAPQQQQAPATPEQMMQQVIQGDPQRLSQMAQFLTQGANMGYDGQKASLGQARDSQIAQLENNYRNAVQEGALSVKEAEAQFQAELENINKNAYLDQERSTLQAQDRGIQNSQQYMGMMATDNQRKNTLINTALSERDSRINTIKDRIKNIGLQKDSDITMANTNHDYTLAGQRAQLGQGLMGQMFGLANDDYNQRQSALGQFAQMGMQNQYQLGQMDKQQEFNLENMAKQNGFDLEKRSVQQRYQLEQMAKQQGYKIETMGVQHGYDLSKLSTQQRYTLEQMATSQGYNLQNMSQQQVYQLAQMATQNGYNVGMENLQSNNQFNNALGLNTQQHEFAMQEAQKNSELRIAEETKAYDLAVQRELSKYQKGSKEYDIRAGQLASEREALITEIVTQAQVEATIQHNLGTPVEKPKKPKKDWWETKGMYESQMDKYNTNMERYEAYQRALTDPMSMFP